MNAFGKLAREYSAKTPLYFVVALAYRVNCINYLRPLRTCYGAALAYMPAQ